MKISVDCGEYGYSIDDFECEVERLNAVLGIPEDDNWREIVIKKEPAHVTSSHIDKCKAIHYAPEEKN